MNGELPKVAELDIPTTAYERHIRHAAAQAVEQELFPQPNEPGKETVEISLWVRGREIRTLVDNETLHRIVAILLGEP